MSWCTAELVVSYDGKADRYRKKCVCEDCRIQRNRDFKAKWYNPADAQAKREARAAAEGRVYVRRKEFK